MQDLHASRETALCIELQILRHRPSWSEGIFHLLPLLLPLLLIPLVLPLLPLLPLLLLLLFGRVLSLLLTARLKAMVLGLTSQTPEE